MYEWVLESLDRVDDTEVSVTIVLNQFKEYRIGRKRGYEITCLNPLVSRNHGIITFKPNGYIYIRDLQSSNGTFINDSLIEPSTDVLLHKNDLLGIGAPSNAQEPKKELFRVLRRLRKDLEESKGITPKEEAMPSSSKLEVPQMESDIPSSSNVSHQSKAKEKRSLKNIDKIKNNKGTNLLKESKNLSDNKNILGTFDKESNNISNINKITKDVTDENKSESKNDRLDNRTTNDSAKPLTESENKNNIDRNVKKKKFVDKESKNSNKDENNTEPKSIKELKVKSTSDSNESVQSRINKSKIDKDNIAKSSDNNKNSATREGCSETPALSNLPNNNDKEIKTTNEPWEKPPQLQNESSLNTSSLLTKTDVKVDTDYINELKGKRHKRKESYEEIIISSDEDNAVNIKNEPNHSFTMNDDDDIVIVIDDDEDNFPKSQLFEMKEEPEEQTSAVADLKDTHQELINIKNEVHDYDDYNEQEEDALDDDDCRIWYIKLSQSQDFISSSQKRKQEVVSPEPEEDFFPLFDDRDLEIDLEEPKIAGTSSVLPDAEENENYVSLNKDLEKNIISVEDKQKQSKETDVEETSGVLRDAEQNEDYVLPDEDLEKNRVSVEDKQKQSKETDVEETSGVLPDVVQNEEYVSSDENVEKNRVSVEDKRKESKKTDVDEISRVLSDAEENEDYFSPDEDLEKNRVSVPVEDKEKESKETPSIVADKRPEISKVPSIDETDTEHPKNKEKKKWYVKPPVIEAPHLIKGKRKALDEPKLKETKSRKKKKYIHESASSSTTSLATATGSSIAIDKSVKTELDKRHKRRRKSTEVYSKDEKLKIQEDRKKKLKEIASKKIGNKETPSKKSTKEKKEIVHKPHTKPKVKVSNSRGLFLTGEEEAKEISLKKKADVPLEQEPPAKKKYTIPKTSNSSNNKPSTSKKTAIIKINKLSFNDLNATNKETKEKPKKYPEKKISTASENNKKEFIERRPSTSTENRKEISQPQRIFVERSNGILVRHNHNKPCKAKKKVRFILDPQIQYIERSPGSNCRKVNSKDAPIPVMNNRNENEILSTLLCWKPAWLEEQKVISVSPQVSVRKPLRMLTNFNSVGDYMDIVTPLMLLELWRNVFKDWCSNNTPIKLARIEHIVSKPDGLLYLSCYCLAERDEIDNYPRQGDLLIAEYYFDKDSKVATTKKFGYVFSSNKRRMTPTDHIHKQFSEFGPIAPFKVQFDLLISCMNVTILKEKLMRIRLVSRISPSLRMFKPVSCLNNSLLSNLILKPNIQQYKVTRPTQMTSVIEDDLNADQMMCIYEAYQICTRNEPGIYMIQGPPGTGKSFVIKNLVRQLLCDINKNPYFKPRILLCAPSNGAIDEITHTLLDMRCQLPKKSRFKMIRLGPPNAIKPVVRSISVPELVSKHIHMQQNNNLKNNHHVSDEYNFWIKKENTLKNVLMSLEARNQDCALQLQQLKKAQEKIALLSTNRNHFTHQDRRLQEKEAEMSFLANADIICTTLSSCVGSKLEEMVKENKIEFTCCIVDEATQSNEQESLIPLLLNINKFVLVGDPEQLPPTTLSKEAKHLGYGNSLFSRIQSCFEHLTDNPIRMLTQQYRMHPEICRFPSLAFYAGKLHSSEAIAQRDDDILDPCRLFCLNCAVDYKETEYLNKTEADLVLLLTEIIVKRTKYNVGVITPYTKQKDYLIKKWRAKDNKENMEDDRHNSRVAINTVDGFQGQERDVIIISAVRYTSNLFLNDTQRLNVALTRAKHACFVCAHVNLFKTESIWQKLEIDAKSRKFFYLLTEMDVVDERYMSKLIFRH